MPSVIPSQSEERRPNTDSQEGKSPAKDGEEEKEDRGLEVKEKDISPSSPAPPKQCQTEEEEDLNDLQAESEKSVEQTELELNLVDAKTEPVEFNLESLPSISSSSQDLLSVDTKTKVYLKPPMSPELMIAIAVRNLDPQKVAGASCSDIVAFLCLHFPYFTDNYLECKVIIFR